MQTLIRQAGSELIRRRFGNTAELIAAVYAALVQFLVERHLIHTGPFDASPCRNATMEDLDAERMTRFIRDARHERGFPLTETARPAELLTHLNLLDNGRPTNAAVLLFGRRPQRFLYTSEVKCAHFHGTTVAKPIPSYQVYKGTVFELVDQAVDFVLSKIALSIGTRAESTRVPVRYEIPKEVVIEAIVNAVAHRDYTSNASVQVMLFTDRLEVWNPGTLPRTLTLEMLREPHASIPGNPLVAEGMYLTAYIERMGTGTGDMIRRCVETGLSEPEFRVDGSFVTTVWRHAKPAHPVRPESRPESQPGSQPESQPGSQPELRPESLEMRILALLRAGPLSKAQISAGLGQKGVSGQLNKIIRTLLADQNLEYTLPDKPSSRLQKYRITEAGRRSLLATESQGPPR